jgi:hypothetical protein
MGDVGDVGNIINVDEARDAGISAVVMDVTT